MGLLVVVVVVVVFWVFFKGVINFILLFQSNAFTAVATLFTMVIRYNL